MKSDMFKLRTLKKVYKPTGATYSSYQYAWEDVYRTRLVAPNGFVVDTVSDTMVSSIDMAIRDHVNHHRLESENQYETDLWKFYVKDEAGDIVDGFDLRPLVTPIDYGGLL